MTAVTRTATWHAGEDDLSDAIARFTNVYATVVVDQIGSGFCRFPSGMNRSGLLAAWLSAGRARVVLAAAAMNSRRRM